MANDWIEDGEKYAVVGLSVKVGDDLPRGQVADHLRVLVGEAFDIPPHWQEWLGSIRMEEVQGCNLFLLSKLASDRPGVLDDENKLLTKRANTFYVGLLLASYFASADDPVLLTGTRRDGEVGVSQHSNIDRPVPRLFNRYPRLTSQDLHVAARLGEMLCALTTVPPDQSRWRLLHVLEIYVRSRTRGDLLERLHQYCRCVDGLILPEKGKTKRQFKSRTELFIGPGNHDLMGEIYDVRSDVEHLNEHQFLEGYDRDTRLDLVKKEAVIEWIARSTLAKIVTDDALWAHFSNTGTLEAFWALAPDERQRVWGDPIDPLEALAEFDPDDIHDGVLGAR